MAEYPALIVHRKFDAEGGDLPANPIGTGAYKIREHRQGEHTLLERTRDPAFGFKAEWWGGGVYLDRIRYFDHGADPAASVAALVADEVDFSHHVDAAQAAVVAESPELALFEAASAHTGVMRMKVTEAPFGNAAVRQAVQACVDRGKMLEAVNGGLGAVGEDHHVAPVHPDYAPLPALAQDHERARALLAEAGHDGGLALTIDCAAEPVWQPAACKALAEMCKPAGISLTVNVVPPEGYRERWLTTPFGLTGWDHRGLGVQVLNLAYRTGAPWNESSYASAAFDSLLDEAGRGHRPRGSPPVDGKGRANPAGRCRHGPGAVAVRGGRRQQAGTGSIRTRGVRAALQFRVAEPVGARPAHRRYVIGRRAPLI